MAGARQLLRACHPGRTRTHYRDLLAGLARIRLRRDIAMRPGMIDNALFDQLDRDRIIIDVKHAGFVTGRWTYAAGEFGKVVGPMQPVNRFAPAAAINQIIPIGDYIAQGTALVAEGNAAVHAARALLHEL